ncbi:MULTISPECIES: alpha/beta hydrolase [unclassified Pseudomonas]|uniref:alpha/beta fold hydrolase n=1 Tax=unclassified Pseudomonas TaxID=196821 RepID=UPI00244A3145|nr:MULTISPECIES: alpha/beta hydrolase [unclassified Pseudomonas]MDG9930821.1 alpha/beta hydrolase [Pseudomonas sp. GD04042]MDH0485210.1 alpha/beta hydrolase [Pseudomonas sp. GD04015]MDH0605580.1 alpha/beta hydrolase [Pseudomonas sp. GD03869]
MKKLILGIVLVLACAAGALYFSPSLLIASVQFAERQLAGLSARTATVDGLTLHYYEGGPADGDTLVMIHGFGANRDNWLRMTRHFTERYRVIALDLPGFGESSKPDASYDVASQTERLHAFITALNIEKPHLIGNSMGGHIAALYAARYPDQVSSIALLDNAGITSPRMSEMFQMIERGQPNPLVVRKAEDFGTLMDFVFVNPPPLPDSLKRHFAAQSMANQAHYDMIFTQLREQYVPLEPELPKIQVPVLVLWGDRDRVLDVSSIEVMKPLLQKPTVVVMKDCGHAPMIERPEETAQHYQAFLDSL